MCVLLSGDIFCQLFHKENNEEVESVAQVRTKSQQTTTRRKTTTPEARDAYMSSIAYDAAERRIKEGTASAQEILYFLKMGSPDYQIERQIKSNQAEMLKAKTESLKSAKQLEEKYDKAMKAMRSYAGESTEDDYDE